MRTSDDSSQSYARSWTIVGSITVALMMTAHADDISQERRILCQDIGNSYQCAQAIERAALKKFSKIAKRHEKKLTLHSNEKQIASLVDSGDKAFSFQGLPGDMGYALIEVQYSEGSDFLLIHCRTGQQIRIKGLPVISPDRQRFVTASGDEANYTETALEIFDIRDATLVLDTSVGLDGPGWPANPRWIDAKTIEFSRYSPDGSETISRVYWTTKGWRLKPGHPATP